MIKPEIVAPCTGVRSATLGSSYTSGSGTSFSVPHAAGTLALMIEANPLLSVDSLKQILLLTASDLGEYGDDNSYGYGSLDALTAVRGALAGIGWISGRVTDEYEHGISAVITIQNHPHKFYTDVDGHFTVAFPADLSFTIQINVPTFLQFTRAFALAPGDTFQVDVILTPSSAATLSGTVIDCFGGGADGALVSVLNGGIPDCTTDQNGHFTFQLPAGIYNVYAADSICGDTIIANVQVLSGGVTSIEIILPDNPNLRCSNPDGQGYTVCDDRDPYAPNYLWREVSPLLGGKGVIHNLANDASVALALPFPVTFYGTTYQRVYLNADGNLTFNRSNTNPTNSSLPQSTVRGIFPFWDNLNDQSGGDICTDFIPELGIFVAEWRNVPLNGMVNNESFEVVIYNPAVYQTSSGNAIIEVHYAHVDSAYSCTVGIDAKDNVNYQQFLYNGVYPDHASPLQDQRTLRFESGDIFAGNSALLIASPNITFHLEAGSFLDTALILQNIGNLPLSYHVTFYDSTPVSGPSSALPSYRDHESLDSGGGTDANGFAWIDSDDPNGPAFEFFDISTLGQNLGLIADDTTSDPRPLPWFFPYYYRCFNRVAVSSNGFISFSSCGSYWLNSPVTNSTNPFYVVSPFWDDLDLRLGGAVYSYFDAEHDRFIIQWNSIRHHTSGGPYTCQAILYHDGTIELVYGAMTGQVASATVGLKGRGSTESLQIIYNQPYVHPDLLVRFYRPENENVWCRITDLNHGVIPAQSSVAVPIELINNLQPNETRVGVIEVMSSDADNPSSIAWITLDSRPDSVYPELVITPGIDGIVLSWNRWNTLYYAIYSGSPYDSTLNRFEGAVIDTFLYLPYMEEQIRFFKVQAANGPADPNELRAAGPRRY
jgi:hypothetical protein